MKDQSTLLSPPVAWTGAYSESDKADVLTVIQHMNAQQKTQAWLCERSGEKAAKLNQILKGRYPSPVGPTLAILKSCIALDAERNTRLHKVPLVETSVYKFVNAACHRAHLMSAFAVVSGSVGVGKTAAIKHYVVTHPNAILVEGDPDMTASVLLSELVDALDATVNKSNRYSEGTKNERMRAVLKILKGSERLIILDEADKVSPQTLEYLRRLSDKADIGVVLVGNERLYSMLRSTEGRYGQISSRVVFWPPIIKDITEADATAVVRAALGDHYELTPYIFDAFWQMCDGSMRVLAKGLIPGVADYGLAKGHDLSAELIFKVGQDILNFQRKSRK